MESQPPRRSDTERGDEAAGVRRAEQGWLVDPPPPTVEPLPDAHATKWFRIMGASYLIPD